MKKTLLFLSFFVILFTGCSEDDYTPGQKAPEGEEEKPTLYDKVNGRVVGAYVTWFGTSKPDPIYFTHLYYAFAELYINEKGEYTGFKVQGSEQRFKDIAALKQKNPNLKILIAFSHTIENSDNRQAGGFSLLAKSDEYRKAFAKDCKAFLANWNIDGVDMDWEFPGLSWSGHACDPAVDVENHVLLMKELRATLSNSYLLTFAGYCQDKQDIDGGSRYIDIEKVAQYVDFVNIMTYDMDAAPKHQSAIKSSTAYFDCERSIKAYLDAGMPANKLVMGIPFYGRRSFSASPGAINYKDIIKLEAPKYKIDNWDETASVPYVTENGVYYCGYDNEKSISIKGEWILGKSMKGMMYWDYDGDDAKHTLKRAVWQATMKP